MNKKFFVLLLSIFIANSSYSEVMDTFGFDIVKTKLQIDLSNISGKYLKGKASIWVMASDSNTKWFIFRLKQLKTDSVFINGYKADFKFDNELLQIKKANLVTDTQLIEIYYQGNPVTDTYWGGFYFSNSNGGYAYNMGVAFNEIPHSFGRVWFPCKDNFTDKGTYEFEITTSEEKMAVCNGLPVGFTENPDGTKSWFWKIDQPIPSYLVSVSVGNYVLVRSEYKNLQRNIPVIHACLPEDSLKLKKSFTNLHDCVAIFENKFLPFQFDRIGYVIVPFNMGAMEHATNIAYPRYAIDGTLQYESLMAHEFSHHWWGNLLTCKTAEDMWINEGWARYSEWLFQEAKYGKTAYQKAFLENHRKVLQFAHIIDKSVLPLSPMPLNLTYGTHVYDKGADVVHTLRNFLGDSLFFSSVRTLLNNNKFSNISSSELRDSLTKYTGIALDDFFANWVFEKGFPNFRAEITEYSDYPEICLYQTLRFTDKLYKNCPVDLCFYNDKMEKFKLRLVINNGKETFRVKLPFVPVFVTVNEEMKIAEAKTSSLAIINKTGSYALDDPLLTLNVNEINDSALVYASHHWVGPSTWPSNVMGVRFSDYRYWSIDGIWPDLFKATARIKYNGRESMISGDDYLDYSLKINNEDSIVVLYRKSISSPWEIYPDIKITTGNKTDKIGLIEIYNLKKGDYCLGIKDYQSHIFKSGENRQKEFLPQWTDQILRFNFPSDYQLEKISCYDSFGKLLNEFILSGNHDILIDMSMYPAGNYIFSFIGKNEVFTRKIIKTE